MKQKSWKIDEFDSEIFGLRTAKICSIEFKLVPTLITELKSNAVEYAVARVDSTNFPLIHAFEKNGFYLVDGFVEMGCSGFKVGFSDLHVRVAKKEDILAVKRIAEDSFNTTRYFNDPFLDDKKSRLVYRIWIENSFEKRVADEILVYEANTKIAGFITLQKNGHIPLIAVDAAFQGKGIAKKLIKSSFSYMHEWKVNKIRIETQLQNIPAMRAYSACGFKIVDTFFTLSWHP